MKYEALNFEEKLSLFDEQWAPKVIAEMNEYQFKIVKIKGDVDGAHGSGLEVLAGDIHPVMAVIRGLPHTAADAPHVERARPAGHSRDSGDPAAPGGADIAVLHSFIKGGVEDDV